jgi:hypothetical protein
VRERWLAPVARALSYIVPFQSLGALCLAGAPAEPEDGEDDAVLHRLCPTYAQVRAALLAGTPSAARQHAWATAPSPFCPPS